MATTLEACFDSSESKPTKDDKPGENGVEEPDANGSDLSDLPPERDIEFYDSFTSIPFAKDAPRLMQLFHSHGDACEQAESEALKLAMRPASEIDVDDDQPMKPYYDALDGLDKLHDEAIELEASILRIDGSDGDKHDSDDDDDTEEEDQNPQSNVELDSANAQLVRVFAACLPILKARKANITMAQELLDSAQENLSISLRMESLGL
ncbi:hypothetical protein BDN72DRAFT_765763 [Pluteus cervinus]|uniref:Uncharacterized protein n=1 Tax=Pluteus cervinus TaxID=181527 RepID=A0ACD3B076_9AGAR|nr:hypothetical protein BDN72DRAFT_765763 [Pluteus cervinus]